MIIPNDKEDANAQRFSVISKNKLKPVADRVIDFRSTLKEIVNYKNGILPEDADSDGDDELIPQSPRTPNTPISSDRASPLSW